MRAQLISFSVEQPLRVRHSRKRSRHARSYMERGFHVPQRTHLAATELEQSTDEEVHRSGGADPAAATQDEVRGRDSRPGRREARSPRTADGPAGLERPDQLLARPVHVSFGGNRESRVSTKASHSIGAKSNFYHLALNP